MQAQAGQRRALCPSDAVSQCPGATLSQMCFLPLQAQRGSPGLGVATETTVPTAAHALKALDRPALPHTAAITPTLEGPDGPPSPPSEASSGYFSHSVSTATLSDALTFSLDTTGSSGQTPSSPAAPGQVPEVELTSPSGAHSPQPVQDKHPAQPAPRMELEFPRPMLPPEPQAPASPFRIRKVRTSELKSFTCMLGGGCSGVEEDLPSASGPSNPGEQAARKPEVASDSEEASEVPEWLKEGLYVAVGTNKTGVVRYIGPTDFQEGTWVGVELDLPSGECWGVGCRGFRLGGTSRSGCALDPPALPSAIRNHYQVRICVFNSGNSRWGPKVTRH